MIFYLKQDERMTEISPEQFYEQMKLSKEDLVYFIDEASIDIVRKADQEEYDFFRMKAFIEYEKEEEADLFAVQQQLEEAKVKPANID